MIEIHCHGPLSPEERDRILADAPEGASYAVVEVEGDDLAVSYFKRAPKFERIRRITGYLTGTLDTWNDAKRAEEKDRVKHQFETRRHGDTEARGLCGSESPCLRVGNKPDQEAP